MNLFWVPVSSMISIRGSCFLKIYLGDLSLRPGLKTESICQEGFVYPTRCLETRSLVGHMKGEEPFSACLGHRNNLKRAGVGTAPVDTQSSVAVLFSSSPSERVVFCVDGQTLDLGPILFPRLYCF